jgi:hypothetical protein
VLGFRGRAAALALAGVLARAAGIAGLAATLALARVVALADVLLGLVRGLVLGLVAGLFVRAEGGARRQTRGNRAQHLREFATLHEGFLLGSLRDSFPKEAN